MKIEVVRVGEAVWSPRTELRLAGRALALAAQDEQLKFIYLSKTSTTGAVYCTTFEVTRD